MRPLENGPLAGEWTPKRLLYLASASTIEPLAATLNELGRIDGIEAEIDEVAAALMGGGGTKKAEREDLARRLNAARASLKTIRLAAEG